MKIHIKFGPIFVRSQLGSPVLLASFRGAG
jgi:hypothetical protein